MPDTAILGGGCFWCVEAVLRDMRGILSLTPGYAGGSTDHPTYKQVCSGNTGHAEVVKVEFDPHTISYDDLLRIFFTLHDPTTLNRQGNDIGTQYRSIIFYKDEQQKEGALAVRAEIEKQNLWEAPLVTAIEPLTTFWPAEEMHHDYYERNPGTGYCTAVIAPKVAKMRKVFAARYSA
ncbi:peptide-methionine (S)-S-oxide reductase MsrA [Acetobacter senegalensis]|uniref:Peptide methionine sulfoxide reductase MsrA n=1 Tax=Acetobacter tropicalis NBRC 101654 TaxID=749388 RepID=F7VFL6_9PROT|nr:MULTISPECIES: peptide-methionine (S)-S-oxide reductase MsrA [Acetobacter]MCG4253138.1 peptide-methionine (S)-S-oxide reductase MsrA [Acetobacter senegalensis]GAA09161.1 methionine sulfoxide reductase A [Acetobacter tropicalis NBRC 101654]